MEKERFRKADRLLTILLALWLFLFAGSKLVDYDCSLLVATYLVFLCPFSGYVSFLYSRLQKSERKKANWHSYSALNIHPYITTIVLTLVTIIVVYGIWIRQFA